MRIEYDAALVETVVAEELRRLEARGSFGPTAAYRRRIGPIYELPATERREAEFARAHLATFEDLGLDRVFPSALASAHEATSRVARVLVLAATSPRDEDADLEPSPAGVSARFRVGAWRFGEPAAFLAHLRRELVHLGDLLDPAFGFVHADRFADRPSEDALLRERYRTLWRASVAGRLARADAAAESRGRLAAELEGLWRSIPSSARGAILARLWDGPRPTHGELVAAARDAKALLALAGLDPAREGPTGPAPGACCPLCAFPSHAWRRVALAPAAVERVRADFPDWVAERGICERCADLYEMRSLEPGKPPREVGPVERT